MKKLLAGLTLLLGLAGPALAQTFTMPPPAGVSVLGVPIVATCGTPPTTYTAGAVGFLMMDTTGKLCDSGAGGGVTSNVNVAQINGVTPLMGNGVTGTGSPRVTIASDNTAFAVNATAQAGTNRIGYTSDDPCTQKTKTNAAFSTSSAGPVSIVALSGSTVIYICSISVVADTATKVSFIDGTGGSCASAQHAIWGSTTAASGMSLPDTGGFTMGSGNGTVGVTTAASAFCSLQSGTSLIAGNITYVQQ